jgi:hypothetical protein
MTLVMCHGSLDPKAHCDLQQVITILPMPSQEKALAAASPGADSLVVSIKD